MKGILLTIATLISLLSCSKLSTNPSADPLAFKGIKAIDVTETGSLTFSWEAPATGTVVAYEIYEQDLSSLEATTGLRLSASSSPDSSRAGISQIVLNIPDSEAPIRKGKAVQVLNADKTFFELKNISPGAYAFQMRAVDERGISDTNQKVYLLKIERALAYPGIESVTAVDGKLHLTWPALETSLKGAVQYTIYQGEAFQKSIAITTETSIDLSYRGSRPGSVLNFGVRSTDPKGRSDNNIKVLSFTVPEETSDFLGCTQAEPRGSDRIRIRFAWPEAEYEYLKIFRNGVQVFATKDRGINEYLDLGLQEGETYEYTCLVSFQELTRTGSRRLSVQTLTSNPPVFSGIRSVEITSAHTAIVRWGVSSGVPTAKFKVFVNPGSRVDWDREAFTELAPDQLEANLSTLGDELLYAFGVRACSDKGVCDFNEVTLSGTTPDDGYPKTQGVTGLAVVAGVLRVTAPWQPSMGGISKRLLYIKQDGTSSTNLADYQLKATQIVQDPGNPPQLLSFQPVTDNTTYHVLVRDQDARGQMDPVLHPMTLRSGDTTAPNFIGLSALIQGPAGQEESTLTAVFQAIESEPASRYGASVYQVYLLNGSGNACRNGNYYQSTQAVQYTAGTEVRLDITGLQALTTYSVCIKAADAAGNISPTEIFYTRSTLDTHPPVFDGLQAMRYDQATARMVLAWSPSSSPDLMEYHIHVWKNAADPTTVPVTVIKKRKTEASSGYEIPQSLITFASQELVYALVTACDNAGLVAGGTQNCSAFDPNLAKSVQLSDVDPPRSFIGIKAEPELSTPTQGVVIVRWVAPSDWTDYRGFKVYRLDPITYELGEPIKDCPCSANNCPDRISSCQVDGLDAFRSYLFHVRAYDAAGNLTLLDPVTYSTSKRTSDTESPSFTSLLNLNYSSGTSTLSWAAATDNQYASEPEARIRYAVYRKIDANFADPSNPQLDGQAALMSLQEDRSWLDNGNDYVDGKTFYYTVCALDSTGNRTCDGNVKSKTIPDLIPPVITSISSDKTYESASWTLSWVASDNKTATGALKIQLYQKISTDPKDEAKTSDSRIMNAIGTTAAPNLNGPVNTNTYIHYLLTVEDQDGNVTSKSFHLLSENAITINSLRSTEGRIQGGNLLLLIGDGFKTDVTVSVGGRDCTNLVKYSRRYLTCRAPSQNTGSYSVLVTNPDGSSATLTNGYTYCDPSVPGSCQQVCNLPSTWGTSFASGNGISAATAYVICTQDHLNNVRTQGYNKFYRLEQNVDLSGVNLLPITSSGAWDFRGNFDGNQFALLNWTYENIAINSVGLFKILNFATIKDLGLINFNVRGNAMVGALAGSGATDTNGTGYYVDQTTVTGVFATGSVFAADYDAGGIIGRSYHAASNLNSFVNVTGRRFVGGIFGRKSYGGSQMNSFGSITATGNAQECYTGGVAGYWDAGYYSIANISSTGSVRCTDTANQGANFTGGTFGYLRNSRITQVTASNSVQGKNYVGGVTGYLNNVTLDSVSTSSVVSAVSRTGGLVGQIESSTLSTCLVTGSTNGSGTSIGGIVGFITPTGVVSKVLDCTMQGSVQGLGNNVGGALGYGDVFEMRNTRVTGTAGGASYFGGLVGIARRAVLDSNAAYSSIEAPSGDYVGGLIGLVDSALPATTVSNSEATGRVVGHNFVGGLIGQGRGIFARNTASGDTLGNDQVGGLIGNLTDADASSYNQLERNKARGKVTGTTHVGGLIGIARGYTRLKESASSGAVIGSTYVGGFLGRLLNSYATIELSYASGSVKGNTGVGGFMGVCFCNNASFAVINDSYALGAVVGNNQVGGFAGQSGDIMRRIYSAGKVSYDTSPTNLGGLVGVFWNADGPRNVPDGFWDKEKSGLTSSAGGQGATTSEMFGSTLYANYDPSLWTFASGGYPTLKWTEP